MANNFQVAGLVSNFDWKSLVDRLMEIEHAPADRLAAEKATNNQKVTLLTTLGTKLTALQSSVTGLKAEGAFGVRTVTSSTANSTWISSAASGSATGTYKIAVSQLATAASRAGAADVGKGLSTTSDVSGLTLANLPVASAVTAGTFTVNGQKITVALTDSLQSVFDSISTATGGAVTAAYDAATDKVTLTGTSEVVLGAANDTSNFLRALKLGNNGTTSVTSSASLGTVKTSAYLASANLTTAITAVDGAGDGSFTINGVNIAYNVNTDTLSAVLTRINNAGAGVTATYDAAADRVTLTNSATGDIGISVSESTGGLLGALGLTAGATLTRGKNAEFKLNDGDTLSSQSNTLDATAHGITGLSVTVNSLETQTLTVAADTSAMRSRIDSFIKDFNDVQDFIESFTKVSTDAKGKVTAAALASNREIQSWASTLRSLAFGAVSGLAGSVDRLDDLGIDFISGTNKLQVSNGTKLNDALKNSSTDVTDFFQKTSTGFGVKMDAFLENVGGTSGLNSGQITRINDYNRRLDEQIASIERQLEQRRSIMESAFIAMENAQAKIKQQQSAIERAFMSGSK